MALTHSFLAFPYELSKYVSNPIALKKEDDPNKKLSYQSLRCVLEHLEANKRIHLAARCPYLQNIERTIPLHINSLCLGQSKVTLNRVEYVFQKLSRDFNSVGPQFYSYDSITYRPYPRTRDGYGMMTPGDILVKYQNQTDEKVLANQFRVNDSPNPLDRIQLSFRVDSKEIHHRLLPDSLQIHVAIKKLTNYLFGRRRDIRVGTLKMFSYYSEILRLPIGVQFRVYELAAVFECIESMRPIIKEESFPLQRLTTCVIAESSLNDPIIKTAKTLVLGHISLATLLKMPNQEIILSATSFSEIEILKIVRHLLNSKRNTCYHFIFKKWKRGAFLSKILERVRDQYVPEITEIWIKSTDKNIEPQLQSISFPISATSNLKIMANRFYAEHQHSLRIQVVPIVPAEPNQEQVGNRLSNFFTNFFRYFVNSV